MAQKLTFRDAEFHFCATPQNDDLDQAAYEGLTYVQVEGVVNVGDWSSEDNMISLDLISDDVSAQQKGYRRGPQPTVQTAYIADDDGQIAMEAAAETSDNYACYVQLSNGEKRYMRAVVGAPNLGSGGGEDFVMRDFPLGGNTRLTVVAA